MRMAQARADEGGDGKRPSFEIESTIPGGAAMKTLTENGLTAAALERVANAPDPRMKKIATSLIRHLHGFVREVALTPAECKTVIATYPLKRSIACAAA